MANFDIYQMVTDRIVAQLENGIVPWQQPWSVGACGSCCAYSHATGKAYSLINQFMLGKSGEYLTFKQCQDEGGKIRKGEKASAIVFWKMIVVEEEKDGETITKTVPVLKYYNVFHIDQCEGIKPKYNAVDVKPFEPIEEAENVCDGYLSRSGVKLYHDENSAYYSPSKDEVHLPKKEAFVNNVEYYSTLFHELTHSTGHKSRLNRINTTAAFGSGDYSKEELVAEIGSAAIINQLGFETKSQFENSVAYIGNWIKALKNDKRLIVSAAGRAEKAVDMIMGNTVGA